MSSHNYKHKSLVRRIGEAGNVFLMLFGAIGMVGIIGASTMTIMKGPVRTMSIVTKRTIAENNMIATGKLALIAAASQSPNDCDGDGTIEPIPYDTTIAGFTGGGEVPVTVGATTEDPWGRKYGYCTWDHGTTIDDAACGVGGVPGAGFKQGNATENGFILALVSAGPDGLYQTNCNDDPATLLDKPSGSDDIILGYTYAQAGTAAAGLWNIKSGSPDTAEIQKKLEVSDGASAQLLFDAAVKTLTIGDGTTGTGKFPVLNTDNLQSYGGTGGTINVDSTLSSDQDITTTADVSGTDLIASGDVSGVTGTFSGTFTAGNLATGGTLTVGGSTTLGDDLSDTTTISSDATVGRNLTVTNSIALPAGIMKVSTGAGLLITQIGGGASEPIKVGGIHIGGNYAGSDPIDGEIITSGAVNISIKPGGTEIININATTGATTINDTLDVTGATGLTTLGTSGLATLNSASITNALDMTSGLINNVLDPVDLQDAATKKYVDDNIAAGTGYTENDPQVDTLTAGKWCVANAGGTAIDCTADFTENDPQVGTIATSGRYCRSDGSTINCDQTAGDIVGAGGTVNELDDLTDAITDYATWNMFLGENSGIAVDTLNAYGNHAFGTDTLQSLTTGKQNTAIGTEALQETTTASGNTAVGHNAMYKNIDGQWNTALGLSSLNTNKSLSGNTALGYESMRYANDTTTPSNSYNTALGYQSLYGSTTASANTGTYNTAIGANSLKVNTTGGNNTAIGTSALIANTTGSYNTAIGRRTLRISTTGNNNTVLGYQAGDLITTGSDNIIIGYNVDPSSATANEELNIGDLIKGDLGATSTDPRMGAPKYCDENLANCFVATDVGGGGGGALDDLSDAITDYTVGSNNIFVGQGAGNLTATGSNNTALGENSFNALTGGSYNTASGKDSLKSLTAGFNNTANGYATLYTNTTGKRNTAIGGYTLYSNDSGDNNTASGFNALYSNTTGYQNTASGDETLYSNTTGYRNTAVGDDALYSNDIGNKNTALGYSAGDVITTGSDNIIIGYNVDPSSATANEELNIGDLIKGDLGATSTDPRMGAPKYCDENLANCFVATDVGGGAAGTSLEDADADTKIQVEEGADDDTIRFDTAGTERMVIDDTGDIIIGETTNINAFADSTSTPRLILADETSVGDLVIGSANSVCSSCKSDLDFMRARGSLGSETVPLAGDYLGSIRWRGHDGDGATGYAYELGAEIAVRIPAGMTVSNDNVPTEMMFFTRADGDADQTQRMVLNSTGQLFLGEATTNDASLPLGSYGFQQYTNGSNNDFAIGTANSGHPAAKSDFALFRARGSAGAETAVQSGDQLGTIRAVGHDGSDFITRAEIQFHVDGAVAGGTIPTAIAFTTDDTTDLGIERMRIASDGNIGMGDFTSDVAESILHLQSGDIRLDGGAANEAGCLRFDDTTDKMQFSHDCASFTDMGTGGGGGAINDLSDAYYDSATNYNLFMGHAAPSLGATDIGNTSVGPEALKSLNNTGGTYNVGVGLNALSLNTSGDHNTATGINSLYVNTTGINNTALGSNALRSNKAKSNNTAVGYAAMYYSNDSTTASNTYNTALGADALRGSTTASANTGVRNIALGPRSLLLSTSGQHNIALGYQAGDLISTGSDNIIIGYDIDPSSATASNELNIGNTLYGYLNDDRIGIGQLPAAGVELDVLGDIEYTGTITDVSDRRLKTDITALSKQGSILDKITAIDTYSFRMKDDKEKKIEFGVMAQELEEIFPVLVHTASDEMGTKSVNYTGLISPLIEAVKDLKKLFDGLTTKIGELFDIVGALQDENKTLKAEVNALKSQNQDIIKRLDALESDKAVE